MPRWRSPATAAVAKPTAKIEFRTSAIGWIDPRAIEPDRREDVAAAELRQLPPGSGPLSMICRNVCAERAVDDRQERAPDRERRGRRSASFDAAATRQVWKKQRAVHRRTASSASW